MATPIIALTTAKVAGTTAVVRIPIRAGLPDTDYVVVPEFPTGESWGISNRTTKRFTLLVSTYSGSPYYLPIKIIWDG